MRNSDAPQFSKRIARACGLALWVTVQGAMASQSAGAQARSEPPLTLSAFGNFYAGGSYDKAHPAKHMIGQMYVQYQIPADLKHPFPIVLIHGGDQTGAGWFSTPDGRPGWVQYFLRLGYGVYVVDQVARGRSAFVPEVYGATSGQPLDYVMQKFIAQERYKLWPQAALHTQWPGKGEPGDPAFDQYAASEAQGMENRNLQTQMNVDALAALLDKIGASIILVHSQSGAYAWPLAQARPTLVKAIVAVEPAGPPVHDVVVHSAQRFDVGWDKAIKQTEDDYYRDNPGVKPYGLTSIPLTYMPAVTPQSPLSFVQQEKPERRDLARCWRQAEPARKLVAVGERPIMLLEAEASFYAGYNHCNVEYLQQAEGRHDLHQARRPRHPRQRPHDDAGKEQRSGGAGHRRLARKGVAAGRDGAAERALSPSAHWANVSNDAAWCDAGVRSRHSNTIDATLYDNPKISFIRDIAPVAKRPADVP